MNEVTSAPKNNSLNLTVHDAVRRKFTTALGARYKVQQGEHGEKRNERERDSHRVGLFDPNVEEHLGDEGNGACDEGEQPWAPVVVLWFCFFMC